MNYSFSFHPVIATRHTLTSLTCPSLHSRYVFISIHLFGPLHCCPPFQPYTLVTSSSAQFFFFLNCLYLKRLFECIRNSLLPHHTWNIQNTLNNCSPSHLRIVMISSTRPMSDLTRPEWCMQFVICFDLYTTSHSHSICHTHVKISSPHFYIISFSAHS